MPDPSFTTNPQAQAILAGLGGSSFAALPSVSSAPAPTGFVSGQSGLPPASAPPRPQGPSTTQLVGAGANTIGGAIGGPYGSAIQGLGDIVSGNYASGAKNLAQAYTQYQAASGAASSGALGTVVPVLGAALGAKGVYDAYQQHDVKGGVVSGAETGAAIGSIVPGVGTVIGAAFGAIIGGVAAALGHKTSDFENAWDTFKGQDPTKNADWTKAGITDQAKLFSGLNASNPYAATQALLGAIQTNNKAFGTKQSESTQFVSNIAQLAGAAAQQGLTDPAQIVSKVLLPFIDQNGGKSSEIKGPSDPRFQMLQGVAATILGGGTIYTHTQGKHVDPKSGVSLGASVPQNVQGAAVPQSVQPTMNGLGAAVPASFFRSPQAQQLLTNTLGGAPSTSVAPTSGFAPTPGGGIQRQIPGPAPSPATAVGAVGGLGNGGGKMGIQARRFIKAR